MGETFSLGQEGNAFPFEEIGDSVTGRVVNLEEVQQTDMDTNEPSFWPNGQPKMMFRMTLQTELREADGDDGVRTIYLRGRRKPNDDGTMSSLCACLTAVKQATGGTEIQQGAKYTHTFTSEGVPTKRGYSPPKWYTGKYVPPAMNLDAGQPAAVSAPYSNGAGQKVQTVQQQAQAAPQPVQTDPNDPWAAVINSGKYSADQITAMQAANIDPAKL
jgi:hypothetical protein